MTVGLGRLSGVAAALAGPVRKTAGLVLIAVGFCLLTTI